MDRTAPTYLLDRDAAALAANEAWVEEAVSAAREHRILSTLPFDKMDFWRRSVHTLVDDEPTGGWRQWLAHRGVLHPDRILRLLRLAPRHDVVLLNGGELVDLVYLALAGLAPWIRTPHVIVDAHWHVDPRPWRAALQRGLFRLARPVLAEVQPHSDEEVPIYTRYFGIARSVVKPLPWSTSLNGYGHVVRQQEPGDAIVGGGHSYRDYATLFAAVQQSQWPVHIGLPPALGSDAIVAASAQVPSVRIESGWTYAQYWQKVADSRVFVMPIAPGLTRCTADQTILNAMALGAIVVATSSMSSRLYIRDGENGFLVPEADPAALRAALDRAWNLSADDRRRISSAAQADATGRFSEVCRLVATLQRAVLVAERAPRHAASAATAGTPARRDDRRRWWMLGAATSTATAVAAVLHASH